MKDLKNLGTVLSKVEQKCINGGFNSSSNCCSLHLCSTVDCKDGDLCILACAPYTNAQGTMRNGLCCVN